MQFFIQNQEIIILKLDFEMLTLFYITDWISPKIHYSINKSNWKDTPLSELPDKKSLWSITFDAIETLEFVFCDNTKTYWDNNRKKNYNLSYLSGRGQFIIFKGKIIPINLKNPLKNYAFFLDMDGTLIGDGNALQDWNEYWLANLFHNPSVHVIYNSGRCVTSIINEIKYQNLIWPDYMIGGLGSEIYSYDQQSKQYVPDQYWEQYINNEWDAPLAFKLLKNIKELNGNDFQGNRLGYFVENNGKLQEVISKVEDTLIQNSQLKFEIVVSGEGSHVYFDIFSAKSGKGKAAVYLCGKLRIPVERSIAFGDSMNDVEMLEMCGEGVLVGNRQENLFEWLKTCKKKLEISKEKFARAILEKIKSLKE